VLFRSYTTNAYHQLIIKKGKIMKKALIIYNSQKGTTRKYAEEISKFLEKDTIESKITSIHKCNMQDIKNSDYVFFGCWTSGLMIFMQHPEKIWIDFIKKVPELEGKKIALFTTYKLATGSMFKNMRKHIKSNNIILEMKSRNGLLQESNKAALRKFLEN
jgi:flavodoxin